MIFIFNLVPYVLALFLPCPRYAIRNTRNSHDFYRNPDSQKKSLNGSFPNLIRTKIHRKLRGPIPIHLHIRHQGLKNRRPNRISDIVIIDILHSKLQPNRSLPLKSPRGDDAAAGLDMVEANRLHGGEEGEDGGGGEDSGEADYEIDSAGGGAPD